MHDHAIHQLIRTPCVLRHQDPGPTDGYGDHPIGVFSETPERCYVAQSSSTDTDEVEAERWNVYFLPSTDVDANDAVTVEGMTLEIWGNPWKVIDPVTGWHTHIEAKAVRRR